MRHFLGGTEIAYLDKPDVEPLEKHSWIIQPFLKLEYPKQEAEWAREIVDGLIKKYNMSDIASGYGNFRNWAMVDGQPLIHDYGL